MADDRFIVIDILIGLLFWALLGIWFTVYVIGYTPGILESLGNILFGLLTDLANFLLRMTLGVIMAFTILIIAAHVYEPLGNMFDEQQSSNSQRQERENNRISTQSSVDDDGSVSMYESVSAEVSQQSQPDRSNKSDTVVFTGKESATNKTRVYNPEKENSSGSDDDDEFDEYGQIKE